MKLRLQQVRHYVVGLARREAPPEHVWYSADHPRYLTNFLPGDLVKRFRAWLAMRILPKE